MLKTKARTFAAVALFLSACGKQAVKEATDIETAIVVRTEPVTRGPINLVIEADAVLYPVEQSGVTSKLTAPVRRILVNRGEHVTAGQLLAELESRDLAAAAQETRSQYEQAQTVLQTVSAATVPEDRAKAEADVRSSRESLDAASKVYESRNRLQKEGALAQKLVDDSRLAMVQAQTGFDTARYHLDALSRVAGAEQVKGAQAQVAAARAHNDSAAVQLGYAQILSPLSGVVADRPVYPGETASAGSPIITVINVSRVVARANIPLRQAAALKSGMPAAIIGPDGSLNGRITVVSPAADPNTTTVEVWVEAENPGERLKPGGTVHLAIHAATIVSALVVPDSALLSADEGGDRVLVLGPDSTLHSHRVTAGVRDGARVQILAGISEGDRVVTSGGLGVSDGAKATLTRDGQ